MSSCAPSLCRHWCCWDAAQLRRVGFHHGGWWSVFGLWMKLNTSEGVFSPSRRPITTRKLKSCSLPKFFFSLFRFLSASLSWISLSEVRHNSIRGSDLFFRLVSCGCCNTITRHFLKEESVWSGNAEQIHATGDGRLQRVQILRFCFVVWLTFLHDIFLLWLLDILLEEEIAINAPRCIIENIIILIGEGEM